MSASSKLSSHSVLESRHHHQQAFELFYEMRANSELCDITLKLGNLTLPAHKVVLAATSPFFRQEFSLKEDGSNSYELSLPDGLKPDAMAAMLDYLYTGYLRINSKNMTDLLPVACFIKNEQALQAIMEKVLANVSISNCLRLQQITTMNDLAGMRDKVERFIEWNFEHVAKDPSFLLLDGKVVKDIIKRDNLKVPNEEVVYDAVYSWYMHKRLERHEIAEWVFQEVRFEHIPEEVLQNKIFPEIVSSEELCSELIGKALDYHRDPTKQPKRLRQPLTSLYVISKKDSIAERFDPIYGTCVPCYAMVPLDDHDGETRCTVKIRDDIYTVYENRVEKFDPLELCWGTVGPGIDTRGAGVCSSKNCLYVIGGRSNNENVFKFDVKKSKWTDLPTMPQARTLPGVCVVGIKLYVIGGYTEKRGPLSSVDCYNTKKGEWTTIKPLNIARFQCGVVVVDNAIYVIGGRDNTETLASIEVLEPKTKTWKLLDSGLIEARNDFAAVAMGNDIYCFGGLGVKTVERFNTSIHGSQIVGNTGINTFAIDGVLYTSI